MPRHDIRLGSTTLGGILVVVALLAITALGYHLRYVAAERTVVQSPARADARDYLFYAYNLKFSGVYSRQEPQQGRQPLPDAMRSPGYPVFIMPWIDDPLTVKSLKSIVSVQVILGVVLIPLAFLFSRPLVGSPGALAVAALTAISPHLVNAGLYILTETLCALTLGLIFWAIAKIHFSNRGALLLVGLLIGIGALVRPTLNYYPAVLVLVLLLHFGIRIGAARSAWLLLGFALIFTPWSVRNAIHVPSGDSNQLMINTLHHGMYPDFMYRGRPESYGFPYRADPRSAAIASSRQSVLSEIGRRFQEEPARHLRWFLLGKPATLWSWNIVQGMGDSFVYPVTTTPYQYDPLFQTTHRIARTLHQPLNLLALIGALLVWIPGCVHGWKGTTRVAARILGLTLVYWTVLHMIGAPFPRYAVPIRPLLYLFAMIPIYIGWTAAVGKWRNGVPQAASPGR